MPGSSLERENHKQFGNWNCSKNTIKNYFSNRCDKGSYVTTFGSGCKTKQLSEQMKSWKGKVIKQTPSVANEKWNQIFNGHRYKYLPLCSKIWCLKIMGYGIRDNLSELSNSHLIFWTAYRCPQTGTFFEAESKYLKIYSMQIFKVFSLVYSSCTNEFHWDTSIHAYNVVRSNSLPIYVNF
jgi:hypothetical protein